MCRFTDRNAEIKSQLITGCLSEKVCQKGLMNPNMLLGNLINYAKMTETISKQMEQMCLEDANSTTKPTTSINAVANKVTHEQQWTHKRPQQNRCRNCNGKYPHERGPTSCPAFQNQCAYCRRWGHFASVCFRKPNDEDRRRRTNRPPRPQAQTSQRPVNYIEDHQRDSNSGSDTEYVFHRGKVKNLPYFDVSFCEGHQMFNVLADSGATINILSEADYKSLRPTPLLRPTKTVISGFGVKEATPVLGQFSTLLKFRGISCQADIHVIKNPEKPIIGWETCKRLKLLSANTHSVNHISKSDAQTPLPTLKLLEDYTDLFNGLGKLKKKKVYLHIDENIKNCHTCQISTHKPTREPLQMSPLPAAPWAEVSADFGHLQNGKYLLVVTDEYSRYVVVDILDSISTTSVIPRLDKIFAEFGVPVSLKTDNGPPFNSHEFKTYASITGFRHRRITPLWPQANGETESFMHTVKKSIKAALNKGWSWKQELFKFLLDYRTTPHCTTSAPPATILLGRTIKNHLPHLITPIAEDSSIRERDTEAKRKIKQYADRKVYVKPNDLRVGDTVIVKSDNTSKALTPYQPNPMTIIKKKGSMITATHKGSQTTRNSSFFKKIPKPTTNPAHNLLDYPSSEDESYTHTTTPPEYKDNQTQHITLNLRRSSRTKRPPKRFDH